MIRRGFLKLAAAAGIVRYAEPLMAMHDPHEWIEDRGDFVIIRVPEYKIFAGAQIEKPAIFLMGAQSTVRDIRMLSYANILTHGPATIADSVFDARLHQTENERPVMCVGGNSSLTIYGCSFPSFGVVGLLNKGRQ